MKIYNILELNKLNGAEVSELIDFYKIENYNLMPRQVVLYKILDAQAKKIDENQH